MGGLEEDVELFDSKTYRTNVGCGHFYITVCKKDGQIVRVIIYPKRDFDCDITFFDALNRQTTFQTNRELEQAVKDLKGNDHPKEGHYCKGYGIKVKSAMKSGKFWGYSCADAVSQILTKEIEA